MLVQIVRFKSALPDEEVVKLYETRADRYRATPGLIQKYYLRYPATGEHGAVYVWENEDALRAFRTGALAGSIAEIYQVQGAADSTTAEVVMALHPTAVARRPG